MLEVTEDVDHAPTCARHCSTTTPEHSRAIPDAGDRPRGWSTLARRTSARHEPRRGNLMSGIDDDRTPDLLEVLAVTPVGEDVWRSRHVDSRGGRMFGGTTVAHILAAAQSSVADPAQVSSVTVRFFRAADGGIPCDYRVEPVFDGRSSAVRYVRALQQGTEMAMGDIAFHTPRGTRSHGHRRPDADPDSLPRTGMPHRARAIPDGAFDIRFQDDWEDGSFVRRLWFRSIHALPDRLISHQCVMALISDLYFFEPILAQHGYRGDDRAVQYGTTQHSMWFHQAARADEWLLIQSSSPVFSRGRGLVWGDIRTTDGVVVATVVQEVAVRFPEHSPTAAEQA